MDACSESAAQAAAAVAGSPRGDAVNRELGPLMVVF
jgi:hypothetical protein